MSVSKPKAARSSAHLVDCASGMPMMPTSRKPIAWPMRSCPAAPRQAALVTFQHADGRAPAEEVLLRRFRRRDRRMRSSASRSRRGADGAAKGRLKRRGPAFAPPIVHEVLNSPGQPLDQADAQLLRAAIWSGLQQGAGAPGFARGELRRCRPCARLYRGE